MPPSVPEAHRRRLDLHLLKPWNQFYNVEIKVDIADLQHAKSQHANLQQADLHQADDEDADRTITLTAFGTQGTCSLPLDNTVEFPPRAVTPVGPEQDLLRSIHHEAATFYSSHNVLSIPTPHRGPRPKNWEEPIAMARALDGSALVAIGVLLEEIAKDQVESAL
ncbi:hypothetical protein PtA15_6A336 [Puccinia triticina]|uniref:Uncharacterized protein n=1 Tax=Puccinia triticina TaxID=208348 RepID=A0ABY7CSL1_9BASI|nr:uncharacterized protein PtA15_6A336 [Puccinia triticina]WAQ85707.1 hypothetical protein PtA15_6A336 [Puccinia triticina]WAR55582.1 hypothetical protein PtB15_6B324 [Puccinia triticina]